MDDSPFDGIAADIAAVQAKLGALTPPQRRDGIARLRASFKRRSILLDAADEYALEQWANGRMTTADLVVHMTPRLQELATRGEQH